MREPVTIMCKVCERILDGLFVDEKRQEIRSMDSAKVIGVVGDYKGKKIYMHQSCRNGLVAEAYLQEKK